MQKTCFYRGFEFFKENSLIKKSVEQSQNKECKNVIIKQVPKVYQVQCTMALFWNFGGSAAMILWRSRKTQTSFKTLVSKKAAIWRLKESQSNYKPLQKAMAFSYQME